MLVSLFNRDGEISASAIIDDEDHPRVSCYRWCLHPKGYVVTTVTVSGKPQTIYLHRFVLSYAGPMEVDHKNRNKLDCQKDNLRVATNAQNSANCTKRSHNTSGYKGVALHAKNRNWVAYIGYGGKRIHIGCFSDIIEAAKAYDQKARELYGQFANTNF